MTDAERYTVDPTRRWASRNPGITYRLSSTLERSYSVFHQGKRIPAGGTEREALAKQADIRSRTARGDRVIVSARLTVGEVAEEWYKDASRRLRSRTLTNYRSDLDRHILPRFGQRGIGSLTPQDIVRLVDELEESGLAGATVANALKPLQGTMQHAVFRGLIASNPFTQIPRGYRPANNTTREHREWTTEEVERLIRCGYQLDERPRAGRSYGLIIETLMRTGLRLGECLGLQFGDVDWDAGVLTIERAWTKENRVGPVKTKSSERRVPITASLLQKLAARSLEMNAKDASFIFAPTFAGNPPAQSNFTKRGWNKAVELAGLADGPRVTPHDARHALVSQLASLGLTSSDVAPIMGHSSAGITEAVYQHSFNRDSQETKIREAMERATRETA